MKARPRAVENRVADAMNAKFVEFGLSPVERIPVLGRTGPDLSSNELQLIVDVKSRVEVPRALFFPLSHPFEFNTPQLTGVRLKNLEALWSAFAPTAYLDYSTKMVQGYIDHMEEWTKVHQPDGVSCIVLHRPEMPIGECVAIIHSDNRRRLIEYARHYCTNHVSGE